LWLYQKKKEKRFHKNYLRLKGMIIWLIR